MAKRHVQEGDARVWYQAALLEEMRWHGADTELQESLLEQFRRFLSLARAHLKHEEDAEVLRLRANP